MKLRVCFLNGTYRELEHACIADQRSAGDSYTIVKETDYGTTLLVVPKAGVLCIEYIHKEEVNEKTLTIAPGSQLVTESGFPDCPSTGPAGGPDQMEDAG